MRTKLGLFLVEKTFSFEKTFSLSLLKATKNITFFKSSENIIIALEDKDNNNYVVKGIANINNIVSRFRYIISNEEYQIFLQNSYKLTEDDLIIKDIIE